MVFEHWTCVVLHKVHQPLDHLLQQFPQEVLLSPPFHKWKRLLRMPRKEDCPVSSIQDVVGLAWCLIRLLDTSSQGESVPAEIGSWVWAAPLEVIWVFAGHLGLLSRRRRGLAPTPWNPHSDMLGVMTCWLQIATAKFWGFFVYLFLSEIFFLFQRPGRYSQCNE